MVLIGTNWPFLVILSMIKSLNDEFEYFWCLWTWKNWKMAILGVIFTLPKLIPQYKGLKRFIIKNMALIKKSRSTTWSNNQKLAEISPRYDKKIIGVAAGLIFRNHDFDFSEPWAKILYNNKIFLKFLWIGTYMVIKFWESQNIWPTTVVAMDRLVYMAQNPCFDLDRHLAACSSP